MAAAMRLKAAAREARAWLFDHALPLWSTTGFDDASRCFHERIGLDGAPAAALPRRIRVQARQTAVFARAGRLGWNGPWRRLVETGASILLERGLRPDGGTRHLLAPSGEPADERRDLYDLAFVAFGLSEAARALGDRPDLTAAAAELIAWADTHWAHPEGGFREGELTPTPPRRQNPHMHMFEALLSLHEASEDKHWLDRAGALAALFRDRFFDAARGALPEYFDESWRPLAGEDGRISEPGHQFEWSWLLLRWRALGGGDLGAIAERLRVHGETYGVTRAGVVFDEVYLDGMPRTMSSRLWPHTERIKANVVRFEETRDPAAADAAVEAFTMLMRYCDVPIKGLWRDRLTAEGAFIEEAAPASSFYHIMMAMFELIRVADSVDEEH